MGKRSALLFWIALLSLTFDPWRESWVFAQGAVTTATIAGDVVDKTGAVVPGARIAIKNQETGLTRETTTGEQGQFQIGRASCRERV